MFKDKDLSSKDEDKDKDCIVKDQDKDCILVLKESLRTRTNITGRNACTRNDRERVYPSSLLSQLGERRKLRQRGAGQNPGTNAFLAYFGVRKLLVKRRCDFFARCKAKNWHFHMETMHLGACIAQTARTNHWNLSFLSKSLERVVQRRLQEFLDSNNLMPETQSAYRQYHSTETAMTKVYNDLLLAADQGDVSALCLLDLTAAFDTVDHDLLMLRLERQFGLRGVVLQWFSSYLSDRTFQGW